MSDSPIILIAGPDAEQTWGCVAHRYGKFVSMTPRRIPVCYSYDEVRERVHILRHADPEFARKWAGWYFAGVRVDGQLRWDIL